MFNISVELMDHSTETNGSVSIMGPTVKHISFHVDDVIN